MRAAASVLLAGVTACGDLTTPGERTLPTAELLPLALQTTAPAPITTSFVVANDRPTVRQVLHPDAFNTPYVVLTFPGGSLASLDGTSLGAGDSVTIVIRPEVGLYGFTLSPQGLTFAAADLPSARVSYGQYGDLSVAGQSSAYDSPLDYAGALSLWFEISPGRWLRVAGSGTSGLDAVEGSLGEPGTYWVAAPR